ncbi:putative GGDEF family protein [Vibrio nigripulchritudo MADA3029]|uniref:diguanylate cyclase domain-containing protein n=1 Tax=Vibrio nigripulchritudo TaxID=28173 RepID=UPI0003B2346F|nr:GGDEF domain-containing protein [Vibrio nigripulchritudo]CCN50047.1 putative GGDEF family protein [Vibrio nigripulchritudo MADA3020]CCN56115.1 putative GGDEF family protein [Vibrio nigripulchritudo MADA3021]CCN59052.1 putative GGDEF family protein [Vibrio nigripulchritudo MADA3029]
MTGSLFKKLCLLFFTTLFLTVTIAASMYRIFQEQTRTEHELNQLVRIQLGVDLLRSQLWLFMQYKDSLSLNQVELAQKELDERLTDFEFRYGHTTNLQKMNQSLASLIQKEQQLKPSQNEPASTRLLNSDVLLQSRYNMIIQNMTEELALTQQRILSKDAETLSNAIFYLSCGLVIFSISICGFAYRILVRFRLGERSMKKALTQLKRGNLDYQIKPEKFDREFLVMANFFNKMAMSLRESTVTKDELQAEIARQTMKLQQQKAQLQFLSEHDPLTDLMNRRAIERSLSDAINKANRTGYKIALLFIDLDDFKAVNDSQGHDAGDAILVEVSRRLQHCIRKSDFAGRLGGDEFVVCLDLLDSFDVVTPKAEQIIQSVTAPIPYCGQDLFIGCSIGVSYFPNQTKSADKLTQLADVAMYSAKSIEGNVCCNSQGELVYAAKEIRQTQCST